MTLSWYALYYLEFPLLVLPAAFLQRATQPQMVLFSLYGEDNKECTQLTLT